MATTDSAKPTVPQISYTADRNSHSIHGAHHKRDNAWEEFRERVPSKLTQRSILRNNKILEVT
jgi:hypothetical protein